ncbi:MULTISPECIES: hypothetical protein [Metabacillus]|jgi:hypothetical protein|uniref:Uncharacterized protein n=1 Tax=Metabacillus rhizolycopersici TaxID=2875709 RepID=A0ABS7ULT7_9BACI|nr:MULTISPECIES: hypothetical protein [Metabacillus]MBZ5749287.1 hypothetical protein [Metabacillus rhizolycopersici]MCM3651942.1 hypothetical protein [Metabacillus litoralis]
MGLEWFDRVSGELPEQLESICEKYDQVGHMSIDRGVKHPRIEFFVETEDDDRDYFCTLFFDPLNEEFYLETFDFEYEQTSRTILSDFEDIVDAVHESIHYFMNEDYDDNVILDVDDEMDDSGDIFEEIDVEWETPEVTAFTYEDEVEVTYQFGIVQETGDGVLRRINRIKDVENRLIKDETNFIFSKEEASTIIAMVASHMDSLTEFDLQ